MNNFNPRYLTASEYIRLTPLERLEYDRLGILPRGYGFDIARMGPPPIHAMQTLAQAYNNPHNAR